jgi:hypothetical protein
LRDRMHRGGEHRNAGKAQRVRAAVKHRNIQIVFSYIDSGYGLAGADRVAGDSPR